MYCRECGKYIPDDSTFCSYCGENQKANEINTIDADIKDAQGEAEGIATVELAQKPKMKLWRNRWFWIVTAVLLLIIGGTIIGLRAFNNSSSLATNVNSNQDSKVFQSTLQDFSNELYKGVNVTELPKERVTTDGLYPKNHPPQGAAIQAYKGDTIYSYGTSNGVYVSFFTNSKNQVWYVVVYSTASSVNISAKRDIDSLSMIVILKADLKLSSSGAGAVYGSMTDDLIKTGTGNTQFISHGIVFQSSMIRLDAYIE